MTPEQVKLVKESFWKILPIAGLAADLFYDRLFEIAPEVRPLFPDDLVAQKKKLMAMLAIAVTNLHQVDKIAPAVEDLGRRHIAYGVTAKHFEPVGAALLWDMASPRSGGYWPDGRGEGSATQPNSRYPTSSPLHAREHRSVIRPIY